MEKKFRHLDEKKEQLRDILENADAPVLSAEAREKCEWFLYAAETRGSIEEICEHFGISPTTWYRWHGRLKNLDPENPAAALEERSRRPRTVRQPDIGDHVVQLIGRYRQTLARSGPRSIRDALKKDHGISVSPSTISRVLRRAQKGDAGRGRDGGSCDGAAGAAPGSLAAMLLLFVMAAAFSFAAPSAAEAAGASASFQIDFDSLKTATTRAAGDSFTIFGGTTDIRKTGASVSFQLAPYGFIPAAADSSSAAGDATTTSSGGGGRRGGAGRMVRVIGEAYEAFLRRTGRPGTEEDIARAREEQAADRESPVIRSHRERLLATVDGKRVIYRDVTTDMWFTPFVAFVVGEGIAHGYETPGGWLTGTFGVHNPVTKAEALKMTLLAAGRDVPGDGVPLNRSARGTWAEPYVRAAEDLSLSQYPRSANVHEPQTRAGVLRTILEAIGLPLARKPAQFTDVPADHPDSSVIATASFYDLISGFPDGTFRPQAPMNRAAAAKVMTMLRRMLLP